MITQKSGVESLCYFILSGVTCISRMSCIILPHDLLFQLNLLKRPCRYRKWGMSIHSDLILPYSEYCIYLSGVSDERFHTGKTGRSPVWIFNQNLGILVTVSSTFLLYLSFLLCVWLIWPDLGPKWVRLALKREKSDQISVHFGSPLWAQNWPYESNTKKKT